MPSSLSVAEVEQLKRLLLTYPRLPRAARTDLRLLHARASASDLMVLMNDPVLAHKLRRLETPLNVHRDLLLAWAALVLVALFVLALMLYPMF